jgi:hypothetical protein
LRAVAVADADLPRLIFYTNLGTINMRANVGRLACAFLSSAFCAVSIGTEMSATRQVAVHRSVRCVAIPEGDSAQI